MRGVESYELRREPELVGDPLVKQRADLDGTRIPCLEQIHQPIESPPGVDDVLDEKDVLVLQRHLRTVDEPNGAARYGRVAVARRHEEIHLYGSVNLPHQITNKYKASLQQTEDEQLSIGIGIRDFLAQLAHTTRDLVMVVDDPADFSSKQSGISGRRIHSGT